MNNVLQKILNPRNTQNITKNFFIPNKPQRFRSTNPEAGPARGDIGMELK